MKKAKSSQLEHVAIICDGNRRWARNQGLPVFKGHDYAVKNTIENLVNAALEMEIPYLTFWIFSTENWNRDKEEIEWLMNLFRFMFDKKIKKFGEKDVRVRVIGDRTGLAPDIQQKIKDGEELTKDNAALTLTLAMNYGGHDELTRAMIRIAQDVGEGKVGVESIDQDLIDTYLDTAGMPNPDMIVRTGGDLRMSGFMSWQSEYSEYFFPKFSFPDFTPEKLKELVDEFYSRQRRFGGN